MICGKVGMTHKNGFEAGCHWLAKRKVIGRSALKARRWLARKWFVTRVMSAARATFKHLRLNNWEKFVKYYPKRSLSTFCAFSIGRGRRPFAPKQFVIIFCLLECGYYGKYFCFVTWRDWTGVQSREKLPPAPRSMNQLTLVIHRKYNFYKKYFHKKY